MLHNIWCIYKREMRTYATTSSVYVVMVLFTLISGYFFNRIVDWFAFANPHSSWFAADVNCGCHLWNSTVRNAYAGFLNSAVFSE